MTKKEAIAILKQRIDTVDEYGNDTIWLAITASYFDTFWGKEAEEYKLLNNFRNGTAKNPDTKKRMVKLLTETIEVVKNKGIIQTQKQNFLRRINDNWLSFIITAVLGVLFPAIFSAGFWFGKHDDQQTKSATPANQNAQNKATDTAKGNQNTNH